MKRTYLCIDLKTFYASVECASRHLDPFKTNLIVADKSRGKGTICLAITPAMKALGIRNRCRVFEIPPNVKYIVAPPRMSHYIKISADVYAIYLRYIAKEDIHVYSIDEAFLDVTNYLSLYKMTAKELAIKIMSDIFKELHLTATAGIGTNLFLAKVALDILAKHSKDNIGYLNEELFREKVQTHLPLTDFWQIGPGTVRRLAKHNLFTLKDVSECDEEILYKEFGINAVFLIDHSKGKESCTIKEIKDYKPESLSLTQGQVLLRDYEYNEALTVMKEMVDILSLDMIDKHLVGNSLNLYIGYSKNEHSPTGGSITITETTNVASVLRKYFVKMYKETTDPFFMVRRINVSVSNLVDEEHESFDLFTDENKIKKERQSERAMISLKKTYGKNIIMKANDCLKESNLKERNNLIGGHRSGLQEEN